MNLYGDRQVKGNSRRWKNWMCRFLPTTCVNCMEKHGTVYPYETEFSLCISTVIVALCLCVVNKPEKRPKQKMQELICF